MAKLISEFKEFIVKGNAIDLAVGIIIGGAFGAVVQSLVKDVIMPPIGLVMGGVDFSSLKIPLSKGHEVGEVNPITHLTLTQKMEPVTINIGLFINTLIALVIIGFAVFMVVKLVNMLRREKPKPDDAPPAPPEDIKLLTEIRDALRAR
ncbi:MAG: large-conductance mechanosensitive channel [Phycisphaerales bacterium]|nr:large-conductance mechanosensitive channel [Phycisphaerales bacterium]